MLLKTFSTSPRGLVSNAFLSFQQKTASVASSQPQSPPSWPPRGPPVPSVPPPTVSSGVNVHLGEWRSHPAMTPTCTYRAAGPPRPPLTYIHGERRRARAGECARSSTKRDIEQSRRYGCNSCSDCNYQLRSPSGDAGGERAACPRDL